MGLRECFSRNQGVDRVLMFFRKIPFEILSDGSGTYAKEPACESVFVEKGVMRKGDFVRAQELDGLLSLISEDRDRILEEAHEHAQRILLEAEESASRIISEAQHQFDDAYTRGYEAGQLACLTEWNERAASAAVEQNRLILSFRERLAGIVGNAVERIVSVSGREAFFERVGSTVQHLIESTNYLKICVSAVDFNTAQTVFSDLEAQLRSNGQGIKIAVECDNALSEGACICESDIGRVDASLSTQMAAIREVARQITSVAMRDKALDQNEVSEAVLDQGDESGESSIDDNLNMPREEGDAW